MTETMMNNNEMMNGELNLDELENVNGGSFWRKVAVVVGAVPVGIGCGLLSLTGAGMPAAYALCGTYAGAGALWAMADER